jgi:uncharacterized protein
MKHEAGYRSADVEDRRGARRGVGMKVGLGGTVILALLSLVLGKDLLRGLSGAESGPTRAPDAEEQRDFEFVSQVLDDNQAVWARLLPDQAGQPYRKAKLVVFHDAVESACGSADSAIGPFYCPGDDKVYIDLGFYRDLKGKLGAPGDFAQAYVIAHEIGHHLQNVLGTEERVRREQGAVGKAEKNQLSVRMELQADCYAGIWAKSTNERALLEAGDIEEAMNAAEAIGDDRLQKAATGRVAPERWTHGSSAMRVRWFRRGLETGRVPSCDTFAARDL